MSDVGKDLIESMNEVLAHAKGEKKLRETVVHVPADIDVAAIRRGLGLSQGAFALRFGFSVGTLRQWEQGRRQPDGPARAYLKVIEREPAAVERALAG